MSVEQSAKPPIEIARDLGYTVMGLLQALEESGESDSAIAAVFIREIEEIKSKLLMHVPSSTSGEREPEPVIISAYDDVINWKQQLESTFPPYMVVEGDDEAPQQIFRARWNNEVNGVNLRHHLSISRNPRDERRHFSVDITEVPIGGLQDVLFSANVRQITIIPGEAVLFGEKTQDGVDIGTIVYRNGRFTKE